MTQNDDQNDDQNDEWTTSGEVRWVNRLKLVFNNRYEPYTVLQQKWFLPCYPGSHSRYEKWGTGSV